MSASGFPTTDAGRAVQASGATTDVSPSARWERIGWLARGQGIDADVVGGALARRSSVEAPLAGVPHDACAAVAAIATALACEASQELDLVPGLVDAVAAELEAESTAVAVAAGEQALAETGRLLVPPLVALRVVLDLIRIFAGVRGAAAWMAGAEDVALVASVGSGADRAAGRRRAAAALRGELDGGRAACPIVRYGDRVGAITVAGSRASDASATRLLTAAAVTAAAVLDRWMLLERRAESERLLVEDGEQRLRRVGLDLHDGPLQGSAQLAGELKLLRDQLGELDLRPETRRKLEGRLEDLLARLARVDRELRELASQFESPVVLRTSLEVALAEEVAAFGTRHGIRTSFSVDGWLEDLAPSHAVALYRMLQQALSNVRQHSGAASVSVRVATRVDGVHAEVEDDGVGFDPALVATNDGSRRHLGLAGMRERALLLGGSADVESRPGGPTRVSLFLPMSVPLPDLVGELARALGPVRTRDGGTRARR